MNNYVIAIFDSFEGVNNIYSIRKENAVEAAKAALLAHCKPDHLTEEYKLWVGKSGDTYTDIKAEASNCDLIMSTYIITL